MLYRTSHHTIHSSWLFSACGIHTGTQTHTDTRHSTHTHPCMDWMVFRLQMKRAAQIYRTHSRHKNKHFIVAAKTNFYCRIMCVVSMSASVRVFVAQLNSHYLFHIKCVCMCCVHRFKRSVGSFTIFLCSDAQILYRQDQNMLALR